MWIRSPGQIHWFCCKSSTISEVRTGVLDCPKDTDTCKSQGWSQLPIDERQHVSKELMHFPPAQSVHLLRRRRGTHISNKTFPWWCPGPNVTHPMPLFNTWIDCLIWNVPHTEWISPDGETGYHRIDTLRLQISIKSRTLNFKFRIAASVELMENRPFPDSTSYQRTLWFSPRRTLILRNCPVYLMKLIASFLSNCSWSIKINYFTPSSSMKCPKGSAFSAFLRAILTEEVFHLDPLKGVFIIAQPSPLSLWFLQANNSQPATHYSPIIPSWSNGSAI